jgi:protein SMG6
MLTFFSPQTQQALAAPSASATSIFLHIQSQLFTRIDLDQVQPNLARFIERLELDEPSGEEGEWVMMAVFAIGSLLEFGKPDDVIRRA